MDHYHTDPIPTPEGQSRTHMCVYLFLVTCELCLCVSSHHVCVCEGKVVAIRLSLYYIYTTVCDFHLLYQQPQNINT